MIDLSQIAPKAKDRKTYRYVEDYATTPVLRRIINRGGPGSGHFGHEGRPGQRGGSQPGERAGEVPEGGHPSFAWAKTKPWLATQAEIEAGKYAGLRYDPLMSPGIVAHYYDRPNVTVGPEFFKSDAFGRQSLLYHELGHEVAKRIIAASGDVTKIPALRPFLNPDYEHLPFDRMFDNFVGGSGLPQELLADVYSDLIHGGRAHWESAKYTDVYDAVAQAASDLLMPSTALFRYDPDTKGWVERGGPGSGHFGHEGIPGHRGGSLPGEGGTRVGITSQHSEEKLGPRIVPEWQLRTEMDDLRQRLEAAGVPGVRMSMGRGGFQGGWEESFVLSYRGTSDTAKRILAEAGARWGQAAILIMEPATPDNAQAATDFTLRFEHGLSNLRAIERVEKELTEAGFQGWTWMQRGGRPVLQLNAVRDWGGSNEAHAEMTAALEERLNALNVIEERRDWQSAVTPVGEKESTTYDMLVQGLSQRALTRFRLWNTLVDKDGGGDVHARGVRQGHESHRRRDDAAGQGGVRGVAKEPAGSAREAGGPDDGHYQTRSAEEAGLTQTGLDYSFSGPSEVGWSAFAFRGGPGSGHFGHKGRPGERGGSQPSEGGPETEPGGKRYKYETKEEMVASAEREQARREAAYPKALATTEAIEDFLKRTYALDRLAGRQSGLTALGGGSDTSFWLRLVTPNNLYSIEELAKQAFGENPTDEQMEGVAKGAFRHGLVATLYEYEAVKARGGWSSQELTEAADLLAAEAREKLSALGDTPTFAEAAHYQLPEGSERLLDGLTDTQQELVTGWMTYQNVRRAERDQPGFDSYDDMLGGLISRRGTVLPNIPADVQDHLLETVGRNVMQEGSPERAYWEAKVGPVTVNSVLQTLNASDRNQWIPLDEPIERQAIADEMNAAWTHTNTMPQSVYLAEIASEMWGGSAPQRPPEPEGVELTNYIDGVKFLTGKSGVESVPIYEDYYATMDQNGGREATRDFLEAQYQATQDFFVRMGLNPETDTVRVYRGVKDIAGPGELPTMAKWNPDGATETEPTTVQTYSLASWTTDPEEAMKFAVPIRYPEGGPEGEQAEVDTWDDNAPVSNGYVIAADVPLKDVVAMAHTGFPCQFEDELVIRGGEGIRNARVLPAQSVYDGPWSYRDLAESLLEGEEDESKYYKTAEGLGGEGIEAITRYIWRESAPAIEKRAEELMGTQPIINRAEGQKQLFPDLFFWRWMPEVAAQFGLTQDQLDGLQPVADVSKLEAAIINRGGPGSGHFGHAGRPGERGGSQPGDADTQDPWPTAYRVPFPINFLEWSTQQGYRNGAVWGWVNTKSGRALSHEGPTQLGHESIARPSEWASRGMFGYYKGDIPILIVYATDEEGRGIEDVRDAIGNLDGILHSVKYPEELPLPVLAISSDAGYTARRIRIPQLEERGGPGSGHFGHEGRPGQRGGSQPGEAVEEMEQGYDLDKRAFARNVLEVFPDALARNETAMAVGDILGKHAAGYWLLPDGRLITAQAGGFSGEHSESAAVAYDEMLKQVPPAQAAQLDIAYKRMMESETFDLGMDLAMQSGVQRLNADGRPDYHYVAWQGDLPVTQAQWDTAQELALTLGIPFTEWEVDTFTRHSPRDTARAKLGLVERGGPGSGHFGHAGRPGERGGSMPGGKLDLNYAEFPARATRASQAAFARRNQERYNSDPAFRSLVKGAWLYSTGAYGPLRDTAARLMGSELRDEKEQTGVVTGYFDRTTHPILRPEFGDINEEGSKFVSIKVSEVPQVTDALLEAVAESPDTDQPVYRGIHLNSGLVRLMGESGGDLAAHGEKQVAEAMRRWTSEEEYGWRHHASEPTLEAARERAEQQAARDEAYAKEQVGYSLLKPGEVVTFPLDSFTYNEGVALNFAKNKGGGGQGLWGTAKPVVIKVEGPHNGFNLAVLSGWPGQQETLLSGQFRVQSVDWGRWDEYTTVTVRQESTYAPK